MAVEAERAGSARAANDAAVAAEEDDESGRESGGSGGEAVGETERVGERACEGEPEETEVAEGKEPSKEEEEVGRREEGVSAAEEEDVAEAKRADKEGDAAASWGEGESASDGAGTGE